MQKALLTIGSTLMIGLAPALQAQEIYLDGSVGLSEAEAGPFDADDNFLRIGAGMDLFEQVSVEAGYWDFGSSRDDGVRISADALYGAVKASTDIGNNLELYGRLGLLRWDADVGRFDDDGFDLIFGGGIGLPLGPGQLGVELHFAELDDVDIQTLGVSYSLPLQF